MQKAASSEGLKSAFATHLEQTKTESRTLRNCYLCIQKQILRCLTVPNGF
ncbi:hypothetical protein [Pinibacter soli]|uniref:Uncharacterized protein n=1 Tax=Pinibacter soli TaxID=3044211 RepID=A0ABT6RE79_9BACT|nr:hypothetical protein [Pinibacter soli]MDI3320887.1 hypothetical protein [Pinibacter soli]